MLLKYAHIQRDKEKKSIKTFAVVKFIQNIYLKKKVTTNEKKRNYTSHIRRVRDHWKMCVDFDEAIECAKRI